MNDNEHALGNIPSFICANKILLPEYFPKDIAKKQFGNLNKIIFYPGLKEGIYLWRKKYLLFKNNENRDTIYVRPEPWVAQYYGGQKNFLDPLLLKLSSKYKIVILPRDSYQARHYLALNLNNTRIIQGNLHLDDIASNCLLFIGAGGTMTREFAILGLPTISVYQDDLLAVDRYLLKNGLLYHKKNLGLQDIENIISDHESNVRKTILEKGESSYNLILKLLKNKF